MSDLGSELGCFRLEGRLGKGGMGEVFVARDQRSGDRLALKTLANTHPKLLYRFKREFRALADVEHPNLVRLGELFVPATGPAFFTMELIEGQTFTQAVRGSTPAGQLPDLARLESALRQLVEGLECLHSNRCVHRDVKPSNVLISAVGRVVILDFGIISEATDSEADLDSGILGTPIYMAPEQAAGGSAGPAADYYAVGVILYECLTGQTPFSGPTLQMLIDKQYEPAPDPRDAVAEIPGRLRDLCVRLLHRDPARRPTGPEILARLAPRAGSTSATADALAFIGRGRELGQLERALDDVREHRRAVTVHLRGGSGVGKSTLVEHFLGRGRPTWPTWHGLGLLVLRGRCRQRETVPYKGVDAVVDALSVHLRRIPPEQRQALKPRFAGPLARVFPVLDEIWATSESLADLDANETRGLGWAALRELLTAIGSRTSLAVVIDDFQWTDLDSVAILRTLTRPPDAPVLLLLLGMRDEIANPRIRAWLDEDDGERDVRKIELGCLAEPEARELALTLLRARPDPPSEPGPLLARADAIALRCAGSPFFIGQMVAGGHTITTGVDLDQIVVSRLAELEPAARRMLEVVAVSGGPLAQALVVELGEASEQVGAERVAELVQQGLLVGSEAEGQRIEIAHDRIRELVLASLEPERLVGLHGQIGERLLARSGWSHGSAQSALGDAVFEIVDHLDAGLVDIDALARDRRLELARLNQIAGERARGSAAWASARRYLGLAHQLLEPWRVETSTEHRALRLDIAFGRAQAEAMGQTDIADAVFADLLGWTLSEVELAQIVARRVAILSWFNRLDEAVDLGLAGLARLGLPIARNPSLARGLVEVVRGWLALGRRELEVLRTLPELSDEHVRARLDVLVEVSFVAPYVSPPLLLVLAGYSTRTIRRYGYHVGLSRILTQLGLAIGVIGQARAAAALCDRALQLAELRKTRPLDRINARVLAQFMVWPASRPLRELLASFEAVVGEAVELGLAFEAGYISVAGGFYLLEIDRPLPEVAALLDRLEVRNPGFGGSVNQPGIVLVRRHVQALVEGRAPPTRAEIGPAIAMLRYMGIILEVVVGVLLGDYARATALIDQMPADYPQVLVGVLQIPRFALYSTILEAQRCPAGGLGRVRTLRRIRAHARTARQWAGQGPENFGPMADIIAGELAALLGRHDQAVAAFERARVGAEANGAINLVALAWLRLARVARARDRGQAEAAFASAIASYETWGAIAVATSLRERGLAGL